MTTGSLQHSIQQLEMKLHKILDRVDQLEFENQKLKKQINELKNAH